MAICHKGQNGIFLFITFAILTHVAYGRLLIIMINMGVYQSHMGKKSSLVIELIWCIVTVLWREEGYRNIAWARGISWGIRQYFIVYPDSSHNTAILNYLY